MNNDYIRPNRVTGFRFWCQKVIPLVFDDSLSYYEVLCKLTHFMNEFAESLNQTIDGLEQLQLYFEEFKSEINETYDQIKKMVKYLDGCYALNLSPSSSYVDGLTLSTSECDYIWELGL